MIIRDVAFQTSRRELRRRLVRHLSFLRYCRYRNGHNTFCPFVESLYPNSCYTSEQQRKWSNMLNGRLPVWEYNWVGKGDVKADSILKQWPPNYKIVSKLTDTNPLKSWMMFVKYFRSALSTQRLVDERTRPGVVREISRGVGCGYIVKIDLSQDLLDETGEENGYDTDDSESDDDIIGGEVYECCATGSRKEQSVRINRKVDILW